MELLDNIILKRIQLLEEELKFTNTNKIEANKRTFARHLLDEIIEDYECGGNNVDMIEGNKTIYNASESFCVKALTLKMIEARKYVDYYTNKTGLTPTYRKVAEHLGIKITAAYHRLRGYRNNMERKQCH